MDFEDVIKELRSQADGEARLGMERYCISVGNALGVSVPKLRRLARLVGRDHGLALQLWGSGIHEARILAALVDDPEAVTERQMDRWVGEIDSWDVCDACCGNLFDKTRFAYDKASEWSGSKREFVKRAGFVMMAELAVHDKEAPNGEFVGFLELIKAGATDDRNFVKKAANWALRQIGKRNPVLNAAAIRTAEEMRGSGSRSANWVATDALRELRSQAVQRRLRRLS